MEPVECHFCDNSVSPPDYCADCLTHVCQDCRKHSGRIDSKHEVEDHRLTFEELENKGLVLVVA